MENKHFSHIHNLSPHHIPEGSQINCSGCKFHGSGTIYVCWHCNYFLHEQCFLANRSMQHPAHPAHPLNLVPYPTYPSNFIYCDSCKLGGSGFTYSCSLCEFDLHVHCAYNSYNKPSTNQPIPHETRSFNYPPSIQTDPHEQKTNTSSDSQPVDATKIDEHEKKPSGTKHFSHEHGLQMTNFKEKDTILCSGCDNVISGPAYSCNEFPCNFNLHKSCLELQREIRHKAHPDHPLKLILLSSGYSRDCTCNCCYKTCFGLTYNCSDCDYYLHVECSALPQAVRPVSYRSCGHALSLFYGSPYKKEGQESGHQKINCRGRCYEDGPEEAWVYFCRKCDYAVHTYCYEFDD